MASGSKGSMDAYVAVSADLEAPKPSHKVCAIIFKSGTQITIIQQVRQFNTMATDSQRLRITGRHPFNNYWYWVFEGACY
ncbi:hypothetical protein O9992_28165 [Vibrio lentus]|nr:hypothetical protein [Vibrio lentus]